MTTAPPLIHDAVRAPGQPLDAATRRFMEGRFGRDFTRVRVHTGAKAAESALAIGALAYTAGSEVVFGEGQYAPGTGEGRRLLAHELAHVVQQSPANLEHAGAASSSGGILQRQPDKRADAEKKLQQHLDELARDPSEAHRAWPRLSVAQQVAVSERMRRRYGGAFAQQFLDEAKKGKAHLDVSYYQPGSGPTAGQLTARGYRKAGSEPTGNAAFEVEIWVHPSGRTIRRDVSTWKFGAAGPATKSGAKVKEGSARAPRTEAPPAEVPTQTTDRHEKALDLLDDLHLRNEALHGLCSADPFQRQEAEDAQINWTFSREELRNYGDVDWSGVHPDFWKEVADAAAENATLLAQCCKRDPSNYWFDCKK